MFSYVSLSCLPVPVHSITSISSSIFQTVYDRLIQLGRTKEFFLKLKTMMEYLHDKGGVGGEGKLVGRLLQQLKLSQLHVLQLPVTLPALQLLLERQLEGILRRLAPEGRPPSF